MTDEDDRAVQADLATRFAEGEARHRRGELAEAIGVYQAIIAEEPDHFDALRMLSVAMLQTQRPAEGAGIARRALALRPDSAVAHHNLGNALADLGRWPEALAAFDAALKLNPGFLPSLQRRGVALQQLGRLEEAVASFDAALKRRPDAADVHLARGAALMALRRPAQALESFEAAAALQPDSVAIRNSRGNALLSLSRDREALADFEAALEAAPDYATARYNRGVALMNLEDYEAALEAFDAALALDPQHVEALNNRAIALIEVGRLDEAMAMLNAALARRPGDPQVLSNRGHVLERLGRTEEALALWEQALAADPQYANAHWRRALVRLGRGDFAAGWGDYEHRWRVDTFLRNSSGQVTRRLRAKLDPTLDRADLAGRHVLALGEQGLGDAVMFASMLEELRADAATVTLACDPRLTRLFGQSFPGVRVINPASIPHPAAFDRILALGSLGRLYRNRLEDFPATPYLSTAPEARRQWVERLGPKTTRLRIGLSWRGGIPRTGRVERSLALADLKPLLDLPDCEFVSLQYGDVADEIEAANAGLARAVRAFPKEDLDDFEDLAGLVQSLDVVVSVQTALVHLCGGLGAPCVAMLPMRPEWRYAALPDRMPWYGSVELVRQPDAGAWAPVVDEIAERLRRRAET